MSIEVFTGVPGSGKSLHAAGVAREILNAPRREQPIIANWRLAPDAPVLKPENFHYMSNEEMTARKLTKFAEDFWDSGVHRFQEDYIHVIIDEAQLVWNSRRWSDHSRMSYLEFLSQSRKYGMKIIIIAQSAKMIDNQFRMLIETEVNHRRVTAMGPAGWLVSLPFRGRLFLAVRYLFQTNDRLNSSLRVFSEKDAAMYDSYAKFDRRED